MRLKNLCDVWIYEPITIKKDGETSLKWKYKSHKKMNVQQDIGQLDLNSAGLIDFDRVKIRIDYDYDINKKDGISFEEIETDKNKYTIKPPIYKVTTKTQVGKTIICSCDIYHGE